MPTLGKLQILLAIGALEIWGEAAGTHYMAPGGKPGCAPPHRPHTERRARARGPACLPYACPHPWTLPIQPRDVPHAAVASPRSLRALEARLAGAGPGSGSAVGLVANAVGWGRV